MVSLLSQHHVLEPGKNRPKYPLGAKHCTVYFVCIILLTAHLIGKVSCGVAIIVPILQMSKSSQR